MSKMGHFRRFFMSAGCPVKGVISGDAGSLLMMSSAAQFRLDSCGMNQAIINGMFDAPEQAAGGDGTRGLSSTAFHGVAQRLRNPLRLSTGDKRDAHAGFDKKLVTAPAVLQQRD